MLLLYLHAVVQGWLRDEKGVDWLPRTFSKWVRLFVGFIFQQEKLSFVLVTEARLKIWVLNVMRDTSFILCKNLNKSAASIGGDACVTLFVQSQVNALLRC